MLPWILAKQGLQLLFPEIFLKSPFGKVFCSASDSLVMILVRSASKLSSTGKLKFVCKDSMHAVNVAIFLLDASFSLADFNSVES